MACAFRFAERQEELDCGQWDSILIIPILSGKPRMWALRRYIRNQSQGGTGFQLGRSSGSDTHS